MPLHHVHGVVNVLNCSLWNGATCEMLDGRFHARVTWDRLLRRGEDECNVFMAVPTVYANLVKCFNDTELDPN